MFAHNESQCAIEPDSDVDVAFNFHPPLTTALLIPPLPHAYTHSVGVQEYRGNIRRNLDIHKPALECACVEWPPYAKHQIMWRGVRCIVESNDELYLVTSRWNSSLDLAYADV